jgi:hypothetical protein
MKLIGKAIVELEDAQADNAVTATIPSIKFFIITSKGVRNVLLMTLNLVTRFDVIKVIIILKILLLIKFFNRATN